MSWSAVMVARARVPFLVLALLGPMAVSAAGSEEGPAGRPDTGVVEIPREIPVRRGHDQAELGGGGGRRLILMFALAAAVTVAATVVRRRRATSRPSRSAGWGRWFGSSDPARGARCVHSARLTQRASVHVVRWGEREWLLGCADGAITVIGDRVVLADSAAGETEEPPGGNGP